MKEFGLSYVDVMNEPIDAFYTNILIMNEIENKRQLEYKRMELKNKVNGR